MEWLTAWPAWLAWVVAIALLLPLLWKIIHYLWTFVVVLRTPLFTTHAELIGRNDIPSEQWDVLMAEVAALEAEGFVFHSATHRFAPANPNQPDIYTAVYWHPPTKAYATVQLNQTPWGRSPCSASFVSRLRDGRSIETGAYVLVGVPSIPERYVYEAPLVADVLACWQYHRQRVAGLTDLVLEVSPQASVVLTEHLERELFDHMQRTGHIRPHAVGGYYYTVKGAWAVTRTAIAETRRWQQFEAQQAVPPADVQQEVLLFQQAQQVEAARAGGGWLGKLILLLVSAALFSLMFGVVFSWELLPILLLVLLLHELGHLLAMKLFGYRELSIFFIPLLGAAAMGKKVGAHPLQKVMVYLAGPVPGLVLGLLALLYGIQAEQRLWVGFGIVSLVLNFLNLLPVSPLDGGRVVEVLWLERFPRIRVLFQFLSVLALAGAALAWEDMIIGVVAVLLALGLPNEWRFANLLYRLRQTGNVGRNEQALPHIFRAMHDAYPAHTSPAERYHIAKRVLDTYQAQLPTLGTALFGSLLYAASFVLPLMVSVFWMIGIAKLSGG